MDDKSTAVKILVIDDEQSSLNMLSLLLGALGYTVLTAASGERGLEVFLEEAPAIVLTDIRMPGMDGMEVLNRLKEHSPEVEVIVITGHGDMETAVRSLQLEASDFISKPIQKPALEVALHRARQRIGLRQQLADYTNNLEAKVCAATAEIARSCEQLETLCEISRSAGELDSLTGIIELIKERIETFTKLRCHGLLILNSRRDDILIRHRELNEVRFAEGFFTDLRRLSKPRRLDPSEKRQFVAALPQAANDLLILVPVLRGGELPVGAALIGVTADGTEEEVRFSTLLLSQTAGAIRRAVLQEEELIALRQSSGIDGQLGEIVGRHDRMREVHRLVASIADTDATVLIQGESGTGKELIARRLHALSRRRDKPFVAISCAAYPQSLLESELFGYEKGAFTGATHARRGCFEQANGGTLFLDEIGEIPPAAQVKLLRVLQFREFSRIGSETSIKVDVRVLAATSRNLRLEMEQGNFREDLYYRLHVIPVELPPLRERISDLPALANHFLQKLSGRSQKRVVDVSPQVLDVLLNYAWPGNIRELENAMEHAFILAKEETIQVGDLPAYLRAKTESDLPIRGGLEEVERQHLMRVLKECRGNKNQAAKRLKISRSTLYRKLEAYRILS
jgi:DNA-binding NtrC family response regulator